MTPLQRLARGLGYDLTPRKKAKPLPAQLVAVLERFEVSCVLDVGANTGQYGAMLRDWGYRGRIVSFEPLAEAHAALERRAAGDAAWQVAPRMAIGERDGEIDLEVSSETDMSSILPQSALLREISPTSAVVRSDRVPMGRLEAAAAPYLAPADRIFLKIDTQGFEPQVLAGAGGLLARLCGLQ
ncbi:MAG: FkbM family methyltransferase, partial [Geminicoccaceae bacterium]